MEPNSVVVLAYKRVDGDRSSGTISLVEESPVASNPDPLETFESVTFTSMMAKFASWLVDFTTAGAVIQRTDRSGLIPYVLEPRLVELLRNDPVTAIRSMTYETQKIGTTGSRVGSPAPALLPPLRAGTDSMAEHFGYSVFVRREQGRVECPGCGFWTPIPEGRIPSNWRVVCQKSCKGEFWPSTVFERWISFPVIELLAMTLPRFFLPREWNAAGPWITRSALQEKYNLWISEKGE